VKVVHDLSELEWKLAGFAPWLWQLSSVTDIRAANCAEIPAIPAPVPGSVQQALMDAGVIKDWNVGLNARDCEWVENRHWIYQTSLPDEWIVPGKTFRLRCQGLDYCGGILLNGRQVGDFRGTFVPHAFDLTGHLKERNNLLQIFFDLPPRWLGQFGRTSEMTKWKARFNYTWDWTGRLVQIGVWDAIALEVAEGFEIESFRATTDANLEDESGLLHFSGKVAGARNCRIHVALSRDGKTLRAQDFDAQSFNAQRHGWKDLPVELWWPNGHGRQPLYTLTCRLFDADGCLDDEWTLTVGFKHVAWLPCEGAPAAADPWICAVNGKPIFLQGVNWTPIRTNFADVREEDYRIRLRAYREMNCNLLRVWGGGFPEKETFYRHCDEMGLLVWQDFPLSSSGLDNLPPCDPESVRDLLEIADSCIRRRQHHVSLLLWCGGNELHDRHGQDGFGKPLDLAHPLLAKLHDLVAREDPQRRFLPTTSSGPRFLAHPGNFGKGLHWDVHGPWSPWRDLPAGWNWAGYWAGVDALFHSETGAPGASSVGIIRRYGGEYADRPGDSNNPVWRRTWWWIDWDHFVREKGRQPANMEEYVQWSQGAQAQALTVAIGACKTRFPRCGGILVWMGHDSFPCMSNTSLLDFEGKCKPAANAVGAVFANDDVGRTKISAE